LALHEGDIDGQPFEDVMIQERIEMAKTWPYLKDLTAQQESGAASPGIGIITTLSNKHNADVNWF
jgi:hypothetical protein